MLSPLQQDETHYYATAVISKSNDRLKLATVAWNKEPLESWLVKAENQMSYAVPAPATSYTLPTIPDRAGGCVDDTWTATPGSPDLRELHTAVWTGSEMIIWGGYIGIGVNTGGRYNPATDSWTNTSITNAPTARWYHTAVWSGNQMIVWGGYDGTFLNTGARYDPSTDSWTATSPTGAPGSRDLHTAVWTGSEMILWGGYNGSDIINTGGRYNPSTDSWTATSTSNAPSPSLPHRSLDWQRNDRVGRF